MAGKIWINANKKLVPSSLLFLAGAIVANHYRKATSHNFEHRVISWIGVAVFVIFAIAFLQVFTLTIQRRLSQRRIGSGRAGSIKFMLRLVGFIVILLITLELLNISVAKLLIGGALLGIILGVAAQQALGNFFASIVLIVAHPFSVGDEVTITSGSLGGPYNGTIKDIGLTHTRLKEDNGQIVLLPNTVILAGSSIRRLKPTVKKT